MPSNNTSLLEYLKDLCKFIRCNKYLVNLMLVGDFRLQLAEILF